VNKAQILLLFTIQALTPCLLPGVFLTAYRFSVMMALFFRGLLSVFHSRFPKKNGFALIVSRDSLFS